MNHFDKIASVIGDLPYMQERDARILRDLIVDNDAKDLLELGFFHGKSSAYFAAILEDLGRGHLITMDLKSAARREPSIHDVLAKLGLEHRVTPVYAQRSFTWDLAKMIQESSRPRFDFCYFDGGHTWDDTGFGFVLVDMLLRPGGIVVFDDLPWTIEAAVRDWDKQEPRYWRSCSADERATACVKLVFDKLVPYLGYTDIRVLNGKRWGMARKPYEGARSRVASRGVLDRITEAFTGR